MALKPAWEPIVLAMKPLDGTIAHNALTWGVAGMNIDACRIGATAAARSATPAGTVPVGNYNGWNVPSRNGYATVRPGRGVRPLAGESLARRRGCSPSRRPNRTLTSGTNCVRTKSGDGYHGGIGKAGDVQVSYGDSGGASRFFYCAKATRKERGPGNDHATVKPLALMEYLLTLLSTPDGGVILDPFAGSGTTLLAAQRLGRRCIGVELTEHNCEIARGRSACRLNPSRVEAQTSSGTRIRVPCAAGEEGRPHLLLGRQSRHEDALWADGGSQGHGRAHFHGYDDEGEYAKIKVWSVDDCQRNRFQIGYLCGEDVYAWFDRPLVRHEYRQFLPQRRAGEPSCRISATWPTPGLTYHYQIFAAEMGTGKIPRRPDGD